MLLKKSLIQLSQSPDICRENVGKVKGGSRRKYLGARQKVDDLFYDQADFIRF